MSLCGVTRGSWCPFCINKTEKLLRDWLYKKYGEENIIFQHTVKVGDKKYIFDFYIPQFNLIIELDGLQHFKQVGKWKSPEHTLSNDVNKIKLVIANNNSIIHILQEDVLFNRNNWETKLIDCIYKYDKLYCIFIDNKDLYKNHLDAIFDEINTIIV